MMERRMIVSIVWVLVLSQLAFATNSPTITSVTVDYNNSRITVAGSNFSPTGGAPTISLSGSSLSLVSFSNIQIVANIPSGLQAGTYSLVVANSVAPSQTTTFPITIGAVGPGSSGSFTFSNYCAIAPFASSSMWGAGSDNIARAASGCSKLVFATSQAYTGDLGGVGGANVKCQMAALSAMLPGRWKALITGQVAAPLPIGSPPSADYTRISHSTVEYRLIDYATSRPDIVAGNYAELFSGMIRTSILETELGTMATGGSGGARVWTGLNPDGTDNVASCSGFTSSASSDIGAIGSTTAVDSNWVTNEAITCDNLARLYCVQQ